MKKFNLRKILRNSLPVLVLTLSILIYKEAKADSYYRIDINQDDCIGCGACVEADPVGYLEIVNGKATFNGDASKIFNSSEEYQQYYDYVNRFYLLTI